MIRKEFLYYMEKFLEQKILENNELKEKIIELNVQINNMAKYIRQSNKNYDELLIQNNNLNNDLSKKNEEIMIMYHEIDILKKNNENLISVISEKNINLFNLFNEIENLHKNNQNLLNEIENLRKTDEKYDELKIKYHELKIKYNKILKESLNELINKNIEILSNDLGKIENYDKTIKYFQDNIDAIKIQIKHLSDCVKYDVENEYKSEILELNNKISSLQEQLKRKNNKFFNITNF